jgi:chaperone modulatory protein CbpM
MQTRKFALLARIGTEELDNWVSEGWLVPGQNDDTRDYSEVDLARAHLIRDLRDMGVNDEGIPVVLDLVDQLHGLRRMLREVVVELRLQHRERDRT